MSNFGFETEDPLVPGSPDAWTLAGTWSITAGQFALTVGTTPNENFETWVSYTFVFPVPVAQFTEAFENWVLPGFVGAFPSPSATFVDDFESWLVFTGAFPTPSATFTDDFESWIVFAGAFPGTVISSFTETFESVAIPLPFVANAATDVFATNAAHGLAVNNRVSMSSSRLLPSPVATGFLYYVVSVPSGTEYTVSSTLGGATLDVLDAGLGTHLVARDTSFFWTQVNDSF